MIQINDTIPTVKKIDQYFNEGRLTLIKECSKEAFFSMIKAIALGCVVIWALLKQIDLPYINISIFGIVLNLMQFSVEIGIILEARNVNSTLLVADKMDHSRQEAIREVDTYQTVDSRVSHTYDYLELVEEMQTQTRSKLAEVMRWYYSAETCWISRLNILCKVLAVIFIYFMIKTLCTHSPTISTKIISVVCLVLQIISRLDIIITLLIVTFLFPLLLLVIVGLCICSCCCANRLRALLPNSRILQNQETFNIEDHPELQTIQFSPNTILQTENECKICFQQFEIGDKILILQCSNKHVFHQFCITMWFKVSQTCPLCRRPLEQMVAEPVLN